MKQEIELKKYIISPDNIIRMTNLTEGEKAPDFKTKDQNGNAVSLNDFRGKKVVLYFYPEDDTPTCTIEACNLRDNYSGLKKAGLIVLGVSPDDKSKHKKFEEKYNLPFTLLEGKHPTNTMLHKPIINFSFA